MAPKVLIVLSSHDKLANTGRKTGWYLPEFAHPYYKFLNHADIVIASPKGGEAPLDPWSIEMSQGDEQSLNFLQEQEALWKHTEKLSDFLDNVDSFDAILYVGGHGRGSLRFSCDVLGEADMADACWVAMFDLPTDSVSHDLIRAFYESDKVVAAVCHGPAALVNVKLSDGSPIVSGQTVTGFSNAEEDQVGLSSIMPFMLEDQLVAQGGKYMKADEPWAAKVVVSGKLVTGQNPASAGGVAEAILAAV